MIIGKCPVCGGDMIVGSDMTNADRIRNMTDEELAEWFCTMCSFGDFCPYKDDCDTNGSGVLKWLKAEAKHDNH